MNVFYLMGVLNSIVCVSRPVKFFFHFSEYFKVLKLFWEYVDCRYQSLGVAAAMQKQFPRRRQFKQEKKGTNHCNL